MPDTDPDLHKLLDNAKPGDQLSIHRQVGARSTSMVAGPAIPGPGRAVRILLSDSDQHDVRLEDGQIVGRVITASHDLGDRLAWWTTDDVVDVEVVEDGDDDE